MCAYQLIETGLEGGGMMGWVWNCVIQSWTQTELKKLSDKRHLQATTNT
jgi:hypothetical protein